MSNWLKTDQPCPCGEGRTSYAIDVSGHGHCFKCDRDDWPDKEKNLETGNYTYEFLERRKILRGTHEFFGVKTQIDGEGRPLSVSYVMPNGSKLIRRLDEKRFYTQDGPSGKFSDAGGWAVDKFPAGSAKAITITEGGDDAMSVWQMLGKHPVYAVKSSSSALSDVRRDYEYLNSFEKIYLCLDDDGPGRKAAEEIAKVFAGKVYNVKNAPLKDAHDFLELGREREFRNIWYNAQRFQPESIISSRAAIRKELENTTAVTRFKWPFPTLQTMTGGIELNRQIVLSGLEGTGKTEILHEVIAHSLNEYPALNLGILHLEEPIRDTVKIQVAKKLHAPVHRPGADMAPADYADLFDELVGRDDRVHFFKHFGSEETDIILNTIRFMVAACGCQLVLFDNYQHAVTGRTADRDTEALDYFANRLESLVKELPFALLSISHENANEQTRGSKNISKECDIWINLKRNTAHENEYLRNLQFLTILKNRQMGKTGPAGRLHYDETTATLSEVTEELPA